MPGIVPLLALGLAGCSILAPAPTTTAARIAMLPTVPAPLADPVEIRWNRYGVPYIRAASRGDAAFAIGVVHAHLRLTQLEVMRRIVRGRLAAAIGPVAVEADIGLKTLQLDRAAADIAAGLPPATRRWLERFAAGVNHTIAHGPRPPVLAAFGITPRPFTVEDVVAIGRLAGVDVNWLRYLALLEAARAPQGTRYWERLRAAAAAGKRPDRDRPRGSAPAADGAALPGLFAFAKAGSNAFAVAGARMADGKPALASDPHLWLGLPNLWLALGVAAPGFEAVGLMIPGIPMFAIGRNPDLAWGGTNLRAAASDLYALDPAAVGTVTRERVTVEVRFWPDRVFERRWSPWGPVISDLPRIAALRPRDAPPLALKWLGHAGSDEFTALLAANRARDVEAFRRAFEGYAVSGQNMLAASRAGDIAHVVAAAVPVRRYRVPPAPVLDAANPAHQWTGVTRAGAFRFARNPARGYLGSTNDRPAFAPDVGFYFRQPERIVRLESLLARLEDAPLEDLAAIQRDTVSPAARRLAHAWSEVLVRHGHAETAARLARWPGDYAADSRDALAFERLLAAVVAEVARRLDEEEGTVPPWLGDWDYLCRYALTDLARRDDFPELVEAGAAAAAAVYREGTVWGDVHRLELRHFLGSLPLVGERFEAADLPAAGSRETLLKTAHGLVDGRHAAVFGSQARFLSSLADPDANFVVLLGGQDGWLGSAASADQVNLWRRGEYIALPLGDAAVERDFRIVTTLVPAAP